MSLEAQSWLFSHPSQLVNALALVFVLVGGLLLLGTRWREQLGFARLAEDDAPAGSSDAVVQFLEINRQFYRVGYACLGLGLLISMYSTQL